MIKLGKWFVNYEYNMWSSWKMTNSNDEDIFIKEDPQVNGQQLIQQFDLGVGVATSKISSIILYIMGFGAINIVGLDPTKATVGDLVVRKDLIMAFKLEFKCGWKCVMATKLGE